MGCSTHCQQPFCHFLPQQNLVLLSQMLPQYSPILDRIALCILIFTFSPNKVMVRFLCVCFSQSTQVAAYIRGLGTSIVPSNSCCTSLSILGTTRRFLFAITDATTVPITPPNYTGLTISFGFICKIQFSVAIRQPRSSQLGAADLLFCLRHF